MVEMEKNGRPSLQVMRRMERKVTEDAPTDQSSREGVITTVVPCD